MSTVEVKVNYEGTAQFGQQAAVTQGQNYALWSAAAAAILAGIGAAKQYDMYEQMGDLASAQRDLINSQRQRYEKIIDSFYLPQLKQARAYMWGYANSWGRSIQELVAKCGTQACSYVRRIESVDNAVARTAGVIAAARRALRRNTAMRQIGLCGDSEVRIQALQATLVIGNLEVGKRYEDRQELAWTELYWRRMLGAAQIAQNTMQLGANMLVQSGTQLSSALAGQATLLQLGESNLQNQSRALMGQADVFGGFGALGGTLLGNTIGARAGQSMLARLFEPSQPNNGAGELPGWGKSYWDLPGPSETDVRSVGLSPMEAP
jgi:hypothetical protein